MKTSDTPPSLLFARAEKLNDAGGMGEHGSHAKPPPAMPSGRLPVSKNPSPVNESEAVLKELMSVPPVIATGSAYTREDPIANTHEHANTPA